MSPARRSRLARRLALACLAASFVVGAGANLGLAEAPAKQGWWSRWQLDPATSSTTPSTIGMNPPPQSVPSPPTGDDGGLTVANEADGPAAIAAMFFETEGGGDASLYLAAAPRKKAGTPEPPKEATSSTVPTTLPSASPVQPTAPDDDTIVLPSEATVLACRALSSWERDTNGPWSRRPTWDAAECVPGTVVSGGTAMFWTLFESMQDEDGNYDVVLVPSAPPASSPPVVSPGGGVPSQPSQQAPAQPAFMVNFASPGADTLSVEPDDDDETTTTMEEPPPDEEDVPEHEGGADDLTLASPEFVPAGTPMAPSVSTASPRSTALAGSARRLLPARPILFPDTRLERVMAVSLLLFMAFALWWYGGGSPVRSPRLLGAAAGRSPASAAPSAALRGIGRFARERFGRPPRL